MQRHWFHFPVTASSQGLQRLCPRARAQAGAPRGRAPRQACNVSHPRPSPTGTHARHTQRAAVWPMPTLPLPHRARSIGAGPAPSAPLFSSLWGLGPIKAR
jgi:hypothetical protein